MNSQTTSQDWDALSAYLDNALNQRERKRLETQLQSRPDLRAALNELRQTRYLLRNTPALRVPRNFTLTLQMAGERAMRPRTYPIFRLAFTLASIFLLFTFAGELAVGRFSPAATPAQQEETLVETLAEAPTAGGEAADGQRVAPGLVPVEESEGSVAMDSSPVETQTPGQEMLMVESPTPTPEAMTENALETEAAEESASSAYEPPAEYPAPSVETQPDLQAYDDSGATGNGDRGEISILDGLLASPWRVWQAIFGAIAIVSGLILLFMRRNR